SLSVYLRSSPQGNRIVSQGTRADMSSNPNSVTQIMQSSKGQSELLAELEKFRRTVVVMFTDIKGSTAYFEKYGDVAGLMMVHQCNDALQKIVEAHTGRVIKFIGDAIMATF